MASFEVREEVLNVVLAESLERRGLLSIPETIRRSVGGRTRRSPDITIGDLWGLRIVVEGRFADAPASRDGLVADARRRVEEGISPICLGVIYPGGLRHIENMPELRKAVARARLFVRVVTEGDDGAWAETTVDGIAEILRHSYELLVSEDVVTTAVEQLAFGIDSASTVIAAASAAPARLRQRLGIPEDAKPPGLRKADEESEDEDGDDEE